MANKYYDKLMLWSGFLFLPIYLIGFVIIADFIPAPSPSLTPDEIVTLFHTNSLRIRIGMLVCVIASPLLLNWVISVYLHMQRVESISQAAPLLQILNGALLVVFFMLPPMIWAALAYRTDIPESTFRSINDMAWFAWIISWPFAFFQQIAIATAGFLDKSESPIFPRWLCYLTIWAAISLIPAGLIVFVKSGPFAWNGLFSLYLPLGFYVTWFTTISYHINKKIK